jgi:hypothetical protein
VVRVAVVIVLAILAVPACGTETLPQGEGMKASYPIEAEWVRGSMLLTRTPGSSAVDFVLEVTGVPPSLHPLCYELSFEARCGRGQPAGLGGQTITGLRTIGGGPVWCPSDGASLTIRGSIVDKVPETRAAGRVYFERFLGECHITEALRINATGLALEDVCDLCPHPDLLNHRSVEVMEWTDVH